MDMAQNELVVAVAASAPVPAPIPTLAPATIPVALTGWSPSTIAELEAVGVSKVSADPHELVYMPSPTPVPMPVRVHAPPPITALVPVRLAAPAAPVPVCAPPLSGMGRCRRPLPLSGASCRPPTPCPSIARRHDV